MFPIMINSTVKRLISGFLAASVLLSLPVAALGANYNSGAYGGCAYGTGCAAGTPAAKPAATPPPAATPAPATILLNDFQDYFTASGHTVALAAGQAVNFDVSNGSTSQRHSITVTTINADSVALTFGQGGADVTLNVGETKSFDVNGDNQNDISVTLGSISGGNANLTFRSLTPAPTFNGGSQPAAASPSKLHHYLIIGLWIFLILLGLLILFILFWRRRRKKQQPTTNVS